MLTEKKSIKFILLRRSMENISMTKKKDLDPGSLTVARIREICNSGEQLDEWFIDALARDKRAGVRNIYRQLQKKSTKHEKDLDFLKSIYKYENIYFDKGYTLIAGVDEAGRGPLAGPVVAAAVILPGYVELPGLRDSKKLTPVFRKKMALMIKRVSLDWSVGLSTVNEILCYNIYEASLLAMRRAVQGLRHRPEFLLVDGFPIKDLDIPQQALVKGDDKSASIAAASVIAKVTRDELMRVLHLQYPEYGFDKHKGYATKGHLEALEQYGPCSAHRAGFSPVKRVMTGGKNV